MHCQHVPPVQFCSISATISQLSFSSTYGFCALSPRGPYHRRVQHFLARSLSPATGGALTPHNATFHARLNLSHALLENFIVGVFNTSSHVLCHLPQVAPSSCTAFFFSHVLYSRSASRTCVCRYPFFSIASL